MHLVCHIEKLEAWGKRAFRPEHLVRHKVTSGKNAEKVFEIPPRRIASLEQLGLENRFTPYEDDEISLYKPQKIES